MPAAKIIVDIPLPCAASWEQMQSVAGGRHCAACDKPVVDLSLCSDAALIYFFSQKANAGACCRLRESQMKRELQPARTMPYWKAQWHRAAALLLSIQAITYQSIAQKTKRTYHTVISPKHQVPQKVLKGQVLAFNGNSPLAGISFLIHIGAKDSIRVTSDTNGRFECPLPRAFKNGTISWDAQDAGEGAIIADTLLLSPYDMPDMLKVFWQTVTMMPALVVNGSRFERTYGGLPVQEPYIAGKRSFFKRLAARLRKKHW